MIDVGELLQRIAAIRTSLDEEIGRREYDAARISAARLVNAAGGLGVVLDSMLDSEERQRLVAVHDGASEHWIKALKVLRAYDAEMAKDQSMVVIKEMPPEKPEAELRRLRAERDGDVAAVAAVLHWIKQDYDSGHLLVGMTTSNALVMLENRFAGRLSALNASLRAEGRTPWDLDLRR